MRCQTSTIRTMMKESFILFLAVAFALPGCITQRNISETMQAQAAQMDSLIMQYEQTANGSGFRLLLPYRRPDTVIELPGDTTSVTFLVDSIPGAGREIDTGTQVIKLVPVRDSAGRATLAIQAVTRRKKVEIYLPKDRIEYGANTTGKITAGGSADANADNTPDVVQKQGGWLNFILLILAAFGVAAKALDQWLKK